MPVDETSADERWLCPVCDLIHHHQIEMVVDETKRPAIHCPCPGCKANNRVWNSVDDYLDWLRRYMPAIQEEAANAPQQPQDETDDQRAHRHEVEDLTDERVWEIARQKREGTYQPKSAWGKHRPPD